MVPKKKVFDTERTEQLPAQEKVAIGVETDQALSAEQVYKQRAAERPMNEKISSPGFIP